jgi:hypothetical protein
MDNMHGSDYECLLNQLNEDMGLVERDIEKEIRFTFEDTEMGRRLDVNEWDVVYENDQWWVVADNGSQWSVSESESDDAGSSFQFDLVGETNESRVQEAKEQLMYAVEEFVKNNPGVGHKKLVKKFGKDVGEAIETLVELRRLTSEDGVYSIVEEGCVNEEDEEEEEKDDGSMSEEEWDDKLNQARAARRGRDMEGEEEENDEPMSDEFLHGGLGDDADIGDFDPEQLRMGQHVELEHTNNPAVAMEIAKDHLRENPIYYTLLKRMEAGECDHPEDQRLLNKIKSGGKKSD